MKTEVKSKKNLTTILSITIDKKTIQFGEILQLNKIELNLNNDFLIDLSNIANIDKITYRGIEINLKNNYQFYLKDFNINKLETLL